MGSCGKKYSRDTVFKLELEIADTWELDAKP
jgi:hypothetical protein